MITGNLKLIVRELTDDDAAVLLDFYSDPEAMKFRGRKPLQNLDEVREFLKITQQAILEQKEFRYGIVDRSTGKLVGTFLINPVSSSICKVGCSFGKQYWRKGFAFETVTLMGEYLHSLGYKKMICYIQKENIPSVKMVEKLAFSLVQQYLYPEWYQYEKNIEP